METIKLAIAEDHKVFRQSVLRALSENLSYELMVEAANGKELIESIRYKGLPDIVLLDVKMPEMDGLQTIKSIRKTYGDKPKVLALSMFSEKQIVLEMLKHGADGFVSKSVNLTELERAISKTINGDAYVSSDIRKYVDPRSISSTKAGTSLNPTEIEILKLICSELTNKEIADQLNLPLNTVNTYRTRMIDKLEVRNSIGLVLYAIRNGLHWVD